MTQHVAEPTTGPKFTPTPITIDNDVLTLSDAEAFDWLLGKFIDYTQNKLIWIDVRSVLATAHERKKISEAQVDLEDLNIEVENTEDVLINSAS